MSWKRKQRAQLSLCVGRVQRARLLSFGVAWIYFGARHWNDEQHWVFVRVMHITDPKIDNYFKVWGGHLFSRMHGQQVRWIQKSSFSVIIIIIIYHLTARVVGAPQMILQPVSSILPCSPLPSGTCGTAGLSIPWCTLPIFSPVCFVFFPLSVCLARWFWPDLMNGRHDHTTAVCSLFTMVISSVS